MNYKKLLCFLGALSLFLVMAVPLLLSQSIVSGDINGTITDPSGAVISNATVELKSLERGEAQTTTTNASGYYRFSLLKPGRYAVKVTQHGFRDSERPIDVALGQVTAANFTLQMGAASEILEVTGEAPVINVDNANVSTAFDLRDVSQIPNPGGDLTNIAQLAPGVTMNTSGGYGNFTANGLPATSNLFTINGENNMDPFFNINNSGATNLTLGQNEIQEAAVITNAYSAQYGQQAGAQVNYITKSGTNAFHGSAKYFWNGRVLNANDWFANHQGSDRPFANNNQWGAEMGGPIVKNKLFFHVNTEGLRYVLPTVQNTYIPSPQLTSAVLANIAANEPNSLPLYTQLLDVWTNPTSPGAQHAAPIANSCDDIINSDGTSNLAGITSTTPCILSFSATPTQLSTEWILSARVDHNIGNSDKVFYRFKMDRGLQATYTDPINSNFNATSNQPSYDGQVQWTHVFSGTATNQFIGSGSWYTARFLQNEAKAIATFPYGVQWLSTTFASMNNGAGYFGRQWSFPQGRNITQYQLADDFAVVKGNHTLKAGISFRRYDVSDYNFFYKHPRVYFLSMQDFADGYAYRYRQWFSDESAVPIALYGLGWYGQDEWRVNSKLKLMLGLRMEHNSNPVCQSNCFNQFMGPWRTLQLGPDVPYNQNIQTGLKQVFRGTDAVNFSPRVGFTWSPFANDKTVISGGIGLFYDAMAQGLVEGAFQSPPHVVDQSVYTALWADPTANGGPAVANLSASALKAGFGSGATYNSLRAATGNVFRAPAFTNFAGTFHTPQYQEWNLQVQRALTNNMSISLNYFGTHGIFIPIANGTLNAYSRVLCSDVNGDAVNCGGGFPSAAPNKSYAGVTEWRTGAVSNSNGLTASFNRRFTHGLSFQTNYTWSHGLDDVSNGGAFVYGSDSTGVQLNPLGLRINNYGNSDYDIRHNFNANFVWEPPFKFENRILEHVLGGWSFSSAIFARTGLPYSVLDTNSVFTNLGGTYVLGQPTGAGATFGQGNCVNGNSQCFDPNAFVDAAMLPAGATQAYATYPTQRRNQYRGPNFFDVNSSLMKNFRITEQVKFGFGANFYNLFNHPNFYLPNVYLSSGDPTVGKIQQTVATPASPYGSFVGAAASPRLIQLQAKITF